MTAFALLAAGIAIGWLGSRLADSQIHDCPKCAIEDDECQVLMEITAQRHQAEARMRGATDVAQYRGQHAQSQSTEDLAGWSQ